MEKLESNTNNNNQSYPPLRRPRTREDFYLFCKIILEHENYEMLEDLRDTAQSPMDSAGSTKSESTSSVPEFKSTGSTSEDSDDVDSDSYNLITCFCGKPYAKRPMIECTNCLTWLHLTCAKVKRNNIPDIFYCYKCKLTMQQQQSPHNNITKPSPTKRESTDSYQTAKDEIKSHDERTSLKQRSSL